MYDPFNATFNNLANSDATLDLGSSYLTVNYFLQVESGSQSNQTAHLKGHPNAINVSYISLKGKLNSTTNTYTQAYITLGPAVINALSLSIEHGTFNITSGNITLTNDLLNTGGVVNLNSTNAQIRELLNDGGNVTLGSGTINANNIDNLASNLTSTPGNFTIGSGQIHLTGGLNNNSNFTLGSGKIFVNSQLSNNSANSSYPATFDVGANGEVTVKGSVYLLSGGSYYGSSNWHPSSTLYLTGTTYQYIKINATLGNVEITNPTSELGANINAAGYFKILDNGKLNNKGYNVTLTDPSKTFSMGSGTELILEGVTTWDNAISATNKSIDPASTITYNMHNSSPTISAGSYPRLNIDVGFKALAGDVTLTGNSSINQPLNLSGYSLHIGENTLSLAYPTFISGASANNYIKAGTGKLLINNVSSSPTIFPIGTTTSYTPVSITNNGTSQAFSVGVQDGVSINGNAATSDVVNKTWEVTPAGTGANINLTLQWNASDQAPNFSPTNCVVSHYDQNLGYWENNGVNFGPASGSNPYTLTRNNITSFSPFAVVGPISPLPVELVEFTAIKKDQEVLLFWETASEKNNKGFEVQASIDGKTFTAIGFVGSLNSNSNSRQRYSYGDKPKTQSGLVYYRLKQIDLDGSSAFSKIIALDLGQVVPSISAFPNPFQNQFALNLQSNQKETATLTVTDITGKTVYSTNHILIKGANNLKVDLSDQPTGLYFVRLTTSEKVYTNRLIKQ